MQSYAEPLQELRPSVEPDPSCQRRSQCATSKTAPLLSCQKKSPVRVHQDNLLWRWQTVHDRSKHVKSKFWSATNLHTGLSYESLNYLIAELEHDGMLVASPLLDLANECYQAFFGLHKVHVASQCLHEESGPQRCKATNEYYVRFAVCF